MTGTGTMGRKAIDLAGQKFGKLTATNELRVRDCGYGRDRLCYCDCGNETWVGTSKLTTNHTISCGCWLKQFRRIEYGMASRNEVLDNYKRGALKRGLAWELSDEEFDYYTSQPCGYCACQPSTVRKARRSNGNFTYNGIDRLDNNEGYFPSNVVSCCQICNRAKSDMTMNDFIDWARRLSEAMHERLQ